MTEAKDDGLGIITEIVQAGGDAHSPLYRWMWKHHDRLVELLATTRPDWKRLAEGFAEIGLTGADGRPMSRQAARHTWWRVRRDKANAARGVPGSADDGQRHAEAASLGSDALVSDLSEDNPEPEPSREDRDTHDAPR